MLNRYFRRHVGKMGYGIGRILQQLNSRNIEYGYFMLNSRDYDVFVRTSQSNIVLYIQIVGDEEVKRCFMQFTEDSWIDFIQNKFSKVVHSPSFESFIFKKGENTLDIE